MNRMLTIALLVTLLLPFAALAEEGEEIKTDIDVQIAVAGKDIEEDSSKAEEYGEIPQGFYTQKVRISFDWGEQGRYLTFTGKDVRLDHARYALDYGKQGSYALNVEYNKIPHLFSKHGVTPWSELSPGEWRLPDSVQASIEALNPYAPGSGASYTAALAEQRAYISSLLATGHDQSLGLMRNRGKVGFTWNSNPAWKYGVEYFKENRDGNRPFGTSLGFSMVTELPEHIDYDTQRFRAGVEYAKSGRSFSAFYDASIFRNGVERMIWDNPYRITDRTYSSAYSAGDGTSTAQLQLPADNNGHTFGFTGASNFGKSRLTGTLSYSTWTDDVTLLPFTVNTSIEAIPLPSSTFGGKINNLSANVGFNTRFGSGGSFSAKYRLYDQNNKSDQFQWHEYVRFDQVLEEFPTEEGPFLNHTRSWTTHNFDLDAGWALSDSLNWRVGYAFRRWDRDERDVKKSDTNTFTTSLDARAADWATIRASYQYSRRRYDAYDFEGTYAVVPLSRFDEANLNRNQLRVLAEFAPGDKTTVGFTAGYGKDDYPDTEFGLLEATNKVFGADFSYSVSETGSLSFWYDHTQITSDQIGRQSGASPSTDPRSDWTAGIDDKYDTVGLGFNTDVKKDVITWDVNLTWSKADGAVDLFSPPGGTPDGAVSLPTADETDWISAKTGLDFRIFKGAKLGVWYWFNRYTIDDYAEDTIKADLLATAGTITLNPIQPDYTYHVGWIGLSYLW